MSGKPNEEQAEELARVFLEVDLVNEQINRLRLVAQEIERLIEKRAQLEEQAQKLIADMDCAAPGHFGYEHRLLALLAMLARAKPEVVQPSPPKRAQAELPRRSAYLVAHFDQRRDAANRPHLGDLIAVGIYSEFPVEQTRLDQVQMLVMESVGYDFQDAMQNLVDVVWSQSYLEWARRQLEASGRSYPRPRR